MRRPIRFTVQDADRAFDEWGANCGPGALAAILGLTLEEVRPHIVGFEKKRYTDWKMMVAALETLKADFRALEPPRLPSYGLARIQWEGAWTAPGAHWAARLRHTHWVGSMIVEGAGIGIFDINAINNGSGWSSLENWEGIVVPYILSTCEPEADGKWHVTHALEIM